jgi:formylmethanofuran dehydrogenase subunit E
MSNRSLDEFLGGGEDSEASESEAESAEREETDVAVEDADPELTVEAAQPTYDFVPDGVACESCGETVETRWHADGVGMVCASCKGW